MINRKFHFILLVILPVITFSCKTIAPIAPEIKQTDIPRSKPIPSSLYLPIEIDLKPYFKETEQSIPLNFTGSENNCSGVSYSYKFQRKPIQFSGSSSYLYYEVDGKYSINLNYCPECTSLFDNNGTCVVPRVYASCGIGEPMRRVKVGYATKFKITPDFKFKTTTDLLKFETIDPCEITVFKYDATAKVRKEVLDVLHDLEDEIDQKIASIDLHSKVEEVWQTLSKPIAFGDYGYLNVQPKGISLSEINFKEDRAFLELNLSLQPLFTSNKPETTKSKLPALSEHSPSNGFNIDIDIVADYDSLSSILTSELKGKSVMIKKNEVIFNALHIENASENKIALKIDFSGKRQGSLYLIGTPEFDSLTQHIAFPDLTFDLATKNVLLKSAKWMFNSKITGLIREYAKIDLHPHIEKLRQIAQKEMNGEIAEGIHLSGKITSIELKHIYPDQNKLLVRLNSKGVVKITF